MSQPFDNHSGIWCEQCESWVDDSEAEEHLEYHNTVEGKMREVADEVRGEYVTKN